MTSTEGDILGVETADPFESPNELRLSDVTEPRIGTSSRGELGVSIGVGIDVGLCVALLVTLGEAIGFEVRLLMPFFPFLTLLSSESSVIPASG